MYGYKRKRGKTAIANSVKSIAYFRGSMTQRGIRDTFYVRFLTEQFERERDTRLALFNDQKNNPPVRSRVFQVLKKRIQEGTPKPIGELLSVKDLPQADYRRRKFRYPPREKYLQFGETLPEAEIEESRDATLKLERAKSLGFESGQKRIDLLAKLPTMIPAQPETKQKLYEGISHHGQGRYRYMRERNIEDPEQKFPFPVLSSWDYGWRLGDVESKESSKKGEHIRIRTIEDTFYRRKGIPDLTISACY